MAATSARGTRVVLHVDLDCFYCQVEHKRLSIPRTVPLAVQQWQGLIAVNYAARAAGVSKFSTVKDATAVCPAIRMVHVATYAEGDEEARYHETVDRQTHKVSLDPYRRESAKIFETFRERFRVVERASIDEAFIDVTAEVDAWLDEHPPRPAGPDDDHGVGGGGGGDGEAAGYYILDWTDLGHVEQPPREGEGAHVGTATGPWTLDDVRLHRGAQLARHVRQLVWERLAYTCSAGIAHNKTLAKLGSSRHKPDQQTVVPAAAVLSFLRDMPLGKIRFLGGKLGATVEASLEAKTAGALWQFDETELRRRCGDAQGTWLYNVCRGIDHDPVESRSQTKSMMAAKSFAPVHDPRDLERWMHVLATELVVRLRDEHDLSGRWPKTLQVHYLVAKQDERSKSGPFPAPLRQDRELLAAILRSATGLFGGAGIPLPCVRLALGATGFQGHSAGGQDITRLFARAAATTGAGAAGPVASFPSEEAFRAPLPALPKVIEDGKTTAERRATVLHYFARAEPSHTKRLKPDDDTQLDPADYRCARCGRIVPMTQQAEHTDYHVALDVQQAWQAEV